MVTRLSIIINIIVVIMFCVHVELRGHTIPLASSLLSNYSEDQTQVGRQ